MMVATDKLSVLRINWDGIEERDYSLDLRRIPFSINQQVHYGNMIVIELKNTSELIDFHELFNSRPHT